MADFPPLKNASFLAVFPIYDGSGCLVAAGGGLAACVSKDGGAMAATACGSAMAEVNANAGVYKLTLLADEMNADVVAFKAVSTSASARPTVGVIYTVARQLKDLAFPTTSGNGLVVSSASGAKVDSIAASTITASAFAADAIVAANIAASAISASKLAANAIHGAAVAASTIVASTLGANSIHAAAVAASTLSACKIAANTIDAAAIADGAIDAGAVAASVIVASTFAANAIHAAAIAASTLTASKIGANAIEAAGIAASAISACKIAACALYIGTTTCAEKEDFADVTLNRDMGAGIDSGSSLRRVRDSLRALRNRWKFGTTTASVYKENDTTVAWATTVTQSNASGISESDPD